MTPTPSSLAAIKKTTTSENKTERTVGVPYPFASTTSISNPPGITAPKTFQATPFKPKASGATADAANLDPDPGSSFQWAKFAKIVVGSESESESEPEAKETEPGQTATTQPPIQAKSTTSTSTFRIHLKSPESKVNFQPKPQETEKTAETPTVSTPQSSPLLPKSIAESPKLVEELPKCLKSQEEIEQEAKKVTAEKELREVRGLRSHTQWPPQSQPSGSEPSQRVTSTSQPQSKPWASQPTETASQDRKDEMIKVSQQFRSKRLEREKPENTPMSNRVQSSPKLPAEILKEQKVSDSTAPSTPSFLLDITKQRTLRKTKPNTTEEERTSARLVFSHLTSQPEELSLYDISRMSAEKIERIAKTLSSEIMGYIDIDLRKNIQDHLKNIHTLNALEAHLLTKPRYVQAFWDVIKNAPTLWAEVNAQALEVDEKKKGCPEANLKPGIIERAMNRLKGSDHKYPFGDRKVSVNTPTVIILEKANKAAFTAMEPHERELVIRSVAHEELFNSFMKHNVMAKFELINGSDLTRSLRTAFLLALKGPQTSQVKLEVFLNTHLADQFAQFTVKGLQAQVVAAHQELIDAHSELARLKKQS